MRTVFTGLLASALILGGGAAIAQTTPATTPQASTPPASAATAPTTKTGHTARQASTGHAGFTTEADAKSHCPSDTVVWGNPGSKVLHVSGSKSYGKTKRGGYMCEGEAMKAGYHMAKGEKHS
ncbi:MAG TPA: hypothetical protein VIZ17_01905 [Acetobacteraceae bacterium]